MQNLRKWISPKKPKIRQIRQRMKKITDQEETNAPGGDTEATDSTDDNGDYEYEDPEEGMPE